MMHHGKKGCKEVLGDVMHLSATSSYLYPGAHWPQKLRGTHLNNVFFKSGFNCLLKFACCLQKMGAIVGHECLEVGHFKAQARREAWLNGTYIRSIKQSPNHATVATSWDKQLERGNIKINILQQTQTSPPSVRSAEHSHAPASHFLTTEWWLCWPTVSCRLSCLHSRG